MKSFLDFEGMYDPKRMFAVTNWSDEVYTVNWRDDSGDNFYTLHPGEAKTYPQYLAYYITKGFVDREMYKDAEKMPNNPDGSASRARERAEMAVISPELRRPYEDKTIQEIVEGKESPEVTAMRAKIRKELIIEQGMNSNIINNPDGTSPTGDIEFARPEEMEVTDGEFTDLPTKKTAGRPKKA